MKKVIKTILSIISIIAGLFLFVVAIALGTENMWDGTIVCGILALILCTAPFWKKIFGKSGKSAEAEPFSPVQAYSASLWEEDAPSVAIEPAVKKPVTRDADKPFFSGRFIHSSGLNLPAGVKCKVSVFPDRLLITGMSQDFSLSHSKVRNVSISTQKEVQKHYVSSAGGAVAGGILFGPIGAAIGGSAKEKNIRTYTRFLIFAYGETESAETKYIIFKLGEWNVNKAQRFVSVYKQRSKRSHTTVEL